MEPKKSEAPVHYQGPVHPRAKGAIISACVALVLALYGAFGAERHLDGSRLNVARNQSGPIKKEDSKLAYYTVQFGAYFLPFLLGLWAAKAGGDAMSLIEKMPEKYSGNMAAALAILIGGLAAITAGCMIFVSFLWEYIKPIYAS
jgi:hypothetical protein